jgi:hypothetical protein
MRVLLRGHVDQRLDAADMAPHLGAIESGAES